MALEPIAYQVGVVTSENVLDAIAELRVQAWHANGELPSFISKQDVHNDEHEKHSVHLAVIYEERPVAAARMCIHSTAPECPDPESLQGYEEQLVPPIATFCRLVVHPHFRGRGLAVALSERRIVIAKERKCGSVVVVMEQQSRMKQMEKLGFKRLGPTKIRYLSYAESFVYSLPLKR